MAKIKFDIAISEIKEQKNHEKIWRLRSANFPHILIDILGLDCNVALILCLDMSNWNFLPPMAKLLHPSLERLSHMNEVPVARESGRPHIFSSNNIFTGFCSPGFYEYHKGHTMDRWELIRYTNEGKITEIINRAISLLDRSRL